MAIAATANATEAARKPAERAGTGAETPEAKAKARLLPRSPEQYWFEGFRSES